MSDRGARELAPEVNESANAEPAMEVIELVDDPALAPAELAAAADSADAEAERVATERRELARRIGASQALPPGLRSRLAEVVQSGGTVVDAVQAVEDALPGVLRWGGRELASQDHPAGDVFFRGDSAAMSDEHAAEIARGQLARSGMLRGQRVRVAAD
jgi:hypothetical protein